MTAGTTTFHDRLVGPDVSDLPAGFFDRCMFNLHPQQATEPSIIMGFGFYPPNDAVDGYVLLSDEHEQRNLRYASVLSATERDGAGPFRFELLEPNAAWRLVLGPNDIGVEFDVTWRAQTPPWFGTVSVTNDTSTPTSFDHLFQSGYYDGTLSIDGVDRSVDGWCGQRDRSRGVRTMSGGQGLHIWFQAQFSDYSVGFLLVETRDHRRMLLKGAVMHANGLVDDVTDVRHNLTFDAHRDLVEGVVEVDTDSGRTYPIFADASARGGYMAGAGYGGHHGTQKSVDHIEVDRFPLDGSVNPSTLDSALTDRLCSYTCNGEQGVGIFEFAQTRSRSYEYTASM